MRYFSVFLLLAVMLLSLSGCNGSTGISTQGSADYHLRRLTYDSNFGAYVRSKIRPMFKSSDLFPGGIDDRSLDVSIKELDSQTDMTGAVFTGSISCEYTFYDVRSKKTLFKATVHSRSNSTTLDQGFRSRDLGRNLRLDNVELLIDELEDKGIPEGKHVVYKGDKSNMLAVIALSPLYGVAYTGIAAIETGKAVGEVAGKAASEFGKALSQIDVDAMEEQYTLENWSQLSLAQQEAYISKLDAQNKAFDEVEKKYAAKRQRKAATGSKKAEGGSASYYKRTCYSVEGYGSARYVTWGDQAPHWDKSGLKDVPASGTVVKSDAEYRAAGGLDDDDTSVMKFAESTIEDTFTLWFTCNDKQKTYYEDYAVVKEVLVFNEDAEGFASRECESNQRILEASEVSAKYVKYRNRSDQVPDHCSVKIIDSDFK